MNTSMATLLTIAAFSFIAILLAITLRRKSSRTFSGREVASTVLTSHAKQRMLERKVSSLQIDQLITNPTLVRRDATNNSVRLEGQISGRTLIVWVAEPWPVAATIVKSTAWADVPLTFKIPAEAAGRIIGRGGATVRRIEAAHQVRISIENGGSICRVRGNRSSTEAASHEIMALVTGASFLAAA